jgi:hypothetical protein
MGATGFYLPMDGMFVPLIMPHDTNGAIHNSPVIRMKNFNHASVVYYYGVASRAAGVVTIEACDDMTPTTHPAVPISYYRCDTAFGSAGDDLAAAVTSVAAATGYIPPAAVSGCWTVIEVDSANLITTTTPNPIGFRAVMQDPGAACIMCAFAVLSGARQGLRQLVSVDV